MPELCVSAVKAPQFSNAVVVELRRFLYFGGSNLRVRVKGRRWRGFVGTGTRHPLNAHGKEGAKPMDALYALAALLTVVSCSIDIVNAIHEYRDKRHAHR